MIIQVKILIQQLWLKLYRIWINFINQLNSVDTVKIPRHISLKRPTHLEAHGFSDASVKSYGAYIYVRSLNETGQILCSLLCAKSRLAPIKAISLPQLELCGENRKRF